MKRESHAVAGDSGKNEAGRERSPKCALYSLDTEGGSGRELRTYAVRRSRSSLRFCDLTWR